MNAVMVLDELAGSGELGGDAPVDADCAHAFRILRAVVAGWIDDVSKKRSDHADALLVRLDRWLSTRASVLHHPALRRMVEATTRRVRRQLVGELRRLGVKVVHASETELVVATREHDARAAAAHLEFVTQTVAARPVFRYLRLEPRAFYASLLRPCRAAIHGFRPPMPPKSLAGLPPRTIHVAPAAESRAGPTRPSDASALARPTAAVTIRLAAALVSADDPRGGAARTTRLNAGTSTATTLARSSTWKATRP